MDCVDAGCYISGQCVLGPKPDDWANTPSCSCLSRAVCLGGQDSSFSVARKSSSRPRVSGGRRGRKGCPSPASEVLAAATLQRETRGWDGAGRAFALGVVPLALTYMCAYMVLYDRRGTSSISFFRLYTGYYVKYYRF